MNYVLIFQSINLNISEQDEYMLSYPIIFRITNHINTNMVYDGNGCILLNIKPRMDYKIHTFLLASTLMNMVNPHFLKTHSHST